MFDPHHLLKTLRNNLLTKDLIFYINNTKKRASWSHIIAVYNIDKSYNIRVMRKLNDLYIVAEKNKIMKVSTAAHIFSHSIAASYQVLCNDRH